MGRCTLVVLARLVTLVSARQALMPRAAPLPPHRAGGPPRMAELAESDISAALADEKFAMDISSITAGSERETYIGQGSGVNAGTGVGALAGWVKGLVGKILTRKNRPIYEDLWQIIEDDLLAMVQAHEPKLEQRRTWFAEPGAAPAAHTFATVDGKCEGTVAGYKGGRVDWITTCKFFSSELGFGNLRIDGWADRTTRCPHVAVHLCIVFVRLLPQTLIPDARRAVYALACLPAPQPERLRLTRLLGAYRRTCSLSTSACRHAPTWCSTMPTMITSTARHARRSAANR